MLGAVLAQAVAERRVLLIGNFGGHWARGAYCEGLPQSLECFFKGITRCTEADAAASMQVRVCV